VPLVGRLDVRFHHWATRPQSATSARRRALTARIQHYFEESGGIYGYRRIHADLAAEQTGCSPGLVRPIMRYQGLVACQPRPFRITTEVDAEAAAGMPDLVQRNFTADRPGVKFVGDITYIHTWQGFVYLATVIGCYSKKVVGWSIADHMRTELVADALRNAAATTRIEPLAIWHSDRGSVYTSRPTDRSPAGPRPSLPPGCAQRSLTGSPSREPSSKPERTPNGWPTPKTSNSGMNGMPWRLLSPENGVPAFIHVIQKHLKPRAGSEEPVLMEPQIPVAPEQGP
jgi:hypothetical protein